MALISFLISAASHTVNRKLALLQCMQQITRLSIKAAALSRVYLCANQQLRGSGLLTVYFPCWAGLSSEVDPTARGQSKATCDLVNTARGVRAARACHPASPGTQFYCSHLVHHQSPHREPAMPCPPVSLHGPRALLVF